MVFCGGSSKEGVKGLIEQNIESEWDQEQLECQSGVKGHPRSDTLKVTGLDEIFFFLEDPNAFSATQESLSILFSERLVASISGVAKGLDAPQKRKPKPKVDCVLV